MVKALHVPLPATVDSAAVAGMVDLLRCQGCWALSARFATCFAASVDPADKTAEYPTLNEYLDVGKRFEKAFDEYVTSNGIKTLEEMSASGESRLILVNCMSRVFSDYIASCSKASHLKNLAFSDEEAGSSVFVQTMVDAFFDNDLLHTTRTFLQNAKGSFGLCVSSSLDAHRQGEKFETGYFSVSSSKL